MLTRVLKEAYDLIYIKIRFKAAEIPATGPNFERFRARRTAVTKEYKAVKPLVEAFDSKSNGQVLLSRVGRVKCDASQLLRDMEQALQRKPTREDDELSDLVAALKRKKCDVVLKTSRPPYNRHEDYMRVNPSDVGGGKDPKVKCWSLGARYSDGTYAPSASRTYRASQLRLADVKVVFNGHKYGRR